MFFKMNFIYFVICSCFYFIMSKIASIAASPLLMDPLIDSCLIRSRTVLFFSPPSGFQTSLITSFVSN